MIGKVLDLVIDDVPEEIDLKMRREAYLARQAVAAAKQEVKTILYLQRKMITSGENNFLIFSLDRAGAVLK